MLVHNCQAQYPSPDDHLTIDLHYRDEISRCAVMLFRIPQLPTAYVNRKSAHFFPSLQHSDVECFIRRDLHCLSVDHSVKLKWGNAAVGLPALNPTSNCVFCVGCCNLFSVVPEVEMSLTTGRCLCWTAMNRLFQVIKRGAGACQWVQGRSRKKTKHNRSTAIQ